MMATGNHVLRPKDDNKFGYEERTVISLTPMKSWALIGAITTLFGMRAWLRSPASIAWRLSQFELQARSRIRGVWRSLLRCLRPVIATLLICTILGPTITGCATRTWSDLPSHVHRAWVCTRMPQVNPHARYWAIHHASGTIVDDTNPEEFDELLPYADIVFIYDSTARAESVHVDCGCIAYRCRRCVCRSRSSSPRFHAASTRW